jgi:hypothetical protein
VQEPFHGKSVDYCKIWDCTLRNLEATFCSYDAPRELSEFLLACLNSWYCESCAMYWENNGTCGNESLQIKHAPQSWCYVEAMEDV